MQNTIDLGKWKGVYPVLGTSAVPQIAGISGGATSAMMAALMGPIDVMSFQNTGREAPRTYEFVRELESALCKPIVRLEYRPPAHKGDRPCMSRFEVVTHEGLDRTGDTFSAFMEAINAFRASKGKGPISPWWRSRICTTYMKTRTARNYVNSLGWSKWNEIIGLRADEPSRVARLRSGVVKAIGRLAPLASVGIVKQDVIDFWDSQTFALRLPSLMGNCTGCFLKDQSDLSRALAEPETDAAWWVAMGIKWPLFGGKSFVGYERLASEAPERVAIEKAFKNGAEKADIKQSTQSVMTPERFRLVVIQEKKRTEGKVAAFSCECEGSNSMANMDSEEEEEMIINLPGE